MPDPSPDERAQARTRLMARLLIVALGLLVLAYTIPLFLHARR